MSEERLAVIEERLRALESRLERIEHVLYGNNPEKGIMHRFAVLEERINSMEKFFSEKIDEIRKNIDTKFSMISDEQHTTKRLVIGTFITALISIAAIVVQLAKMGVQP